MASFLSRRSSISDPSTPSVKDEDLIVDDETWTTGDFEIISSDNVRFRVPSYHLISASVLFRDASSLDLKSNSVALTDPAIETAAVVRLFLELAVNGRFSESLPVCNYCLPTLKDLLQFTVKWDAERIRHTFWHILEAAIRDDMTNALRSFILAAQYDNDQLSQWIIKTCWNFKWSVPSTWQVGEGGASVWSPTHWPGFWFENLPPKYLYALSKAYVSATGQEGGIRKHLATEFGNHLELWAQNVK